MAIRAQQRLALVTTAAEMQISALFNFGPARTKKSPKTKILPICRIPAGPFVILVKAPFDLLRSVAQGRLFDLAKAPLSE